MVEKKIWEISKIDIVKINDMMGILSRNKRVFQSEAQFQLELAMLIKEKSGLNIIVEFATLSEIQEEKDKTKKDYTDIIIYDDEGNYIALELKYKTRYMWIEDEKFLLREHGASNLGRYDFLHDVVRLQRLKDTNNLPKKLKKYVNGFAVFLTNESRYWNEKFSRRKNSEIQLFRILF